MGREIEKTLIRIRYSFPYRTFTFPRIAIEATFLALGAVCDFLKKIDEKHRLSEKYICLRNRLFP